MVNEGDNCENESRELEKLLEKYEEMELRYRAVKDESGRLSDALKEERDRHSQAEQSLRASEANLARAQQMAHVGSWCWDLKENRITCSDEFYHIMGYEPGEISFTVDQFKTGVHPEDIPFMEETLNAALRDRKPYSVDFRIVRKDGEARDIHVVTEFTYDEKEDIERIYGTVQDITERKRAEIALQEAKTRAELYVDLMGHDIGNMNQAIMGYLEMALDTLDIKDSRKEFIEKPIQLLKSSSALIDNVKRLQRARSGEPLTDIVDIGALIVSLAAQYSRASGKKVEISFSPAASYRVRANELIKDLFGNIIENAVNYSKAPGLIRIGIAPVEKGRKRYYRVEVEDNGPGVPDKLKSHIFSELSGKERYARRKGLGMQIVKTLVNAYGGKVWVEDRVPGDYSQGARFVVLLPALS
jgi:PAS domain S-box-containing protein